MLEFWWEESLFPPVFMARERKFLLGIYDRHKTGQLPEERGVNK
jgi:hypothetical protein